MRVIAKEACHHVFRNAHDLARVSDTIAIVGTSDKVHIVYLSRDDIDTLSVAKVAPDASGHVRKLRWVPQCNTLFVLQGAEIYILLFERRRERLFFCGKVAAADAASGSSEGSTFVDFDVKVSGKTMRLAALSTTGRTLWIFAGDHTGMNVVLERRAPDGATHCRWFGELCAVSSGDETCTLVSADIGAAEPVCGRIEHCVRGGRLMCAINDSMSFADRRASVYFGFDEVAVVRRLSSGGAGRRSASANTPTAAAGGVSVSSAAHSRYDSTYFPYFITIYQINRQSHFSESRQFRLISREEPRLISTHGPWLFVACGDRGFDMYNWSSGQLLATFFERERITAMWTTSRCVDYRVDEAQWIYANEHHELVLTPAGLATIVIPPVSAIVASLSIMLLDEAQHLMKYGHSVGSNRLMSHVAEQQRGDMSTAINPFHPEFLTLISQFVILDEEEMQALGGRGASPSPSRGSNSSSSAGSPSGGGADKVCHGCGKKFSFLKGHALDCMFCFHPFCGKCIRRASGGDLGYDEVDEVRCCRSCGKACDKNLYTLLTHHKYVEAMSYYYERLQRTGSGSGCDGANHIGGGASPGTTPKASSYDGRATNGGVYVDPTSASDSRSGGLDPQRVLEGVLYQCLEEKRFTTCAEIAAKYINSSEMWEVWITKFSMKKEIAALATAVPSPDVGASIGLEPWMYTTILSQLVKTHSGLLNDLVTAWAIDSYDFLAVAKGIENYLRFKQQEAIATQEQCTTSAQTAAPLAGPPLDPMWERAAAGRLYFDAEVRMLIHALLRLYGQASLHFDAVRCFVEHFITFTSPAMMAEDEVRPRSSEVIPEPARDPPTKRVADDEPYLFDVWRYMVDHQLSDMLFPPKLRREGCAYDGPSILPVLVMHKCEQLAEFLLQLVDDSASQYSFDVMTELVHQLKSTPPALMSFLDAMAARSVTSTSKYHGLLAELYIEFAPHKLLRFIRNPGVHDLDWRRLISTLQQRRMFAEMAYVAGKMGNDREAIRISVRNLKDIPFAIQYIEDRGDATLWQELISHVVQSEFLISEFLLHCNGHYDVCEFLGRIPDRNRLRIPRETERLTNVIRSTRLDAELHQSCLQSVEEENLRLMDRWRRSRNRAVRFEGGERAVCQLCGTGHHVDAFGGCGHQFHKSCFEQQTGRKIKPLRRFAHATTAAASGGGGSSALVAAATMSGGAAADRESLRRSDPGYALVMYSTLREVDEEDISELLPRALFFDVLGYLGRSRCASGCAVATVSKRWRHLALQFAFGGDGIDAPLFQRHHLLELQTSNRGVAMPVAMTLAFPRVVFAPIAEPAKEATCPTCEQVRCGVSSSS